VILSVLGLGLGIGQDILIVIECARVAISARQGEKKRQ
jgi:hypothetical protein